MRALVAVALLVSVAHADPEADALTAQGEQLARDGEYSHAIEVFKKAEAKAPSAKHLCLIGLAYTRRELWSQAEIWLDRCKARSTAQDPLPEWFPGVEAQLHEKLKSVDTAELEIAVSPPDAPASISVSSFPPDETFSPRTIHLVPGNYVITGSVRGQPPVSETVNVKLGATNTVTLAFRTPPQRQPAPPIVPPAHERSQVPLFLFIGAGAVAATGVVFHALAVGERNELQHAQDVNSVSNWRAHADTFENERAIAIGCYAAAAVAATIGIILRSHDEKAPLLTGTPVAGGALVGIVVHR